MTESDYTPLEAYVLACLGNWMTCGGYIVRNVANDTGMYGQYWAFGEYPECVRATNAHPYSFFIGKMWKIKHVSS
jgi:hypothetical protein